MIFTFYCSKRWRIQHGPERNRHWDQSVIEALDSVIKNSERRTPKQGTFLVTKLFLDVSGVAAPTVMLQSNKRGNQAKKNQAKTVSSKTFFSESSILTVRFLGENQIQDFRIQNWIFRFFGKIQKRIMNPLNPLSLWILRIKSKTGFWKKLQAVFRSKMVHNRCRKCITI